MDPKSCPSWARGLKYEIRPVYLGSEVVPLVGTWIEIIERHFKCSVVRVVPLVGTWIEILQT